MRQLADMFYASARLYPDKTAIWCDGKTVTYNQLAEQVSKCSNFFLQQGIAYGDHIGFPMNNSLESTMLIMVAANIGIGLVPINPTLPRNAVDLAFACGDVKHIIARKNFFEQCDMEGGIELAGKKICLDGEYEGTIPFSDLRGYSADRPDMPQVTGDETFFLTMTSGSTGEPKPIELTQNNKYLRAMAHIRIYDITKGDNVLAATPLYHSLAERLVIMPLILGGTSILLPRFTPNLWLNCIKEQKVTFTIAVSAQLSQIAELLSSPFVPDIDSLRCVVSSSALLEPHVKNELIKKLNCDFHEMYGTSEVSTVTDINIKEGAEKRKSVGKPIDEAQVRILREDGSLAKHDEIGEIVCKSRLMCSGYYGISDVMENAMNDGYFRTGDLGYLDADGYLYFAGRKKELIITGGINVYPKDIEECVGRLEEVSECAAFSYPDERLGEVVALAVVPKNEKTITKRMIQIQCARNLADYQQPHKIFIIEELPKNAMGKMMKSKLLEYVRIHCETN